MTQFRNPQRFLSQDAGRIFYHLLPDHLTNAYLVLVGIYSSAISVAEDSTLRRSIRLTTEESKLLDSIGTAHMEQEIQKRVVALTKQHQDKMAEETEIQSSLTEDDMKSYLQEVIKEIQKTPRGDNNHHK